MGSRPLLCDAYNVLKEALLNIQTSSTLILDCEGVRLGRRGGSLSLITLRTTAPSLAQTYLIDVVRLSRPALQPIFDILCSHRVLKVTFDGRMDFSALYHGHGIELQRVLDLQLVDVASRNESQKKHLERLGKYLNRGEINANKRMYVDVHKLSGLAECVQEHSVAGPLGVPKGHGEYKRLDKEGGVSADCLFISEPRPLGPPSPS
jgi:exonuclease 3'-5' domain-containing protein 1